MCRVKMAISALAIFGLNLASAGSASAVSLGTFSCITGNSAADCGIGEAQLSAVIVEDGSDALLTIEMDGPANAVVEQLFLESSSATGLAFATSAGVGQVAFGVGAAGGNLPGGNVVGFLSAWNSSANNPKPRWGVGRHPQDDSAPQAAEFRIAHSGTFEDFLSGLRVGVHVLGYDGGGSESFTAEVPELGSLSTFLSGFLALAIWSRGKARNSSG